MHQLDIESELNLHNSIQVDMMMILDNMLWKNKMRM